MKSNFHKSRTTIIDLGKLPNNQKNTINKQDKQDDNISERYKDKDRDKEYSNEFETYYGTTGTTEMNGITGPIESKESKRYSVNLANSNMINKINNMDYNVNNNQNKNNDKEDLINSNNNTAIKVIKY